MAKRKSTICSPGEAKYKVLTKRTKRRKPGSPSGSPKDVTVKGSAKKKTLWMRWLWSYHCEKKKGTPSIKYATSMTEASKIYKTAKFKDELGKTPTDTELRAYATKMI